ncbi:MAG: peptide chain release factor N(5)-glutamine methyltransferase [Acidimicrobiales bacterium]
MTSAQVSTYSPDDPGRTWREVLEETTAALGSAREARWLAEEAAGLSGPDLVLGGPVTARCGAYLSQMVDRRLAGEPLQYVLGRWGFRSLDLFVDRRVLIPRPETEQVVEWAFAELAHVLTCRPPRHRPVVADLGTGSGAIALSMASETDAEVWATDASSDALDVARANLAGIGTFAATRVRMVSGSWWDALPEALRGRLDLVVSNPPYVGVGEDLPHEVAAFEPAVALRSGPDGLDAIRVILGSAGEWLAPAGVVVVEMAPSQVASVRALARDAGARHVEVRSDLTGRDRAVVARW